MGYSGMLRANLNEDNTIREDLDEIYNASVKAKEIIQQITALSRKNLACAFEPLQLSQIIPRITRVVASLKPADTKLITDLQFGEHYIMGNTTQINQISLNLYTNAFHAMPKGQGTLRVEGSLENCEGAQYAVLRLTDDGKGISENDLGQIFNPFFTTIPSGTGLGLAIVQNIVDLHHGQIHVSSVPGKVTVFTLCFPTVLPKSGSFAPQGSATEQLPVIFLVEPCEKQYLELPHKLNKHYMVKHFINPSQALEALDHTPCHLLITIPAIAFITASTVFAFIAGFSVKEAGTFVKVGVMGTAEMAALFIFSVIFFGLMGDTGMFDRIIKVWSLSAHLQ